MSESMPLNIAREGAQLTVKLSPETVNRFEEIRRMGSRIAEALEQSESNDSLVDHVVLDFSSVDRISSAGLNGLIMINSKSRIHGVHVVLSNVSTQIRDVFELTRLERMFEFRGAGSSSMAVAAAT